MASGALTTCHLLGLAIAACLSVGGSMAAHAQATKPDAVTIIQTFLDTGRSDYRFRSRNEALAFLKAWPLSVDRWVAAGTPDQAERRRHIAALAALEFGRTAFDALDLAGRGDLPEALLESAHASLRQLPPSEFERRWLRATTGMSAAMAPGAVALPAHLAIAAARFPNDPRLRLNRWLADRDVITLAREPGTPMESLSLSVGHGQRVPVLNKRDHHFGRAESGFTALLNDAEVGAEARARLGWLRFHQNNLTESMMLFDRAMSDSDDPYVKNLAAVGLGLTHLAAGRGAEATAAFRMAKAALPMGRGATTALALQLFLAGQREEASQLLDALSGVPNLLDPWKHVNGAGRFAADIIRELRAELGVPVRVAPVPSPPRSLPPSSPVPAAEVAGKASGARPTASGARPVFTATTSIVSVDAAVMNGRRPVEGLGTADFEVQDNGVLQTIEGVSLEGLPLDVTVVLDLRDMAYGMGVDGQVTLVRDATQQGVADTSKFSALLRPDDRLRIVTATADVAEPHPLQGPGGLAVHRVPREMMASAALYDAIFTALARKTPAERRHLVLVFTDGLDGASIVSAKQLLQVATVSDALVQVFRRDTADEFFSRGRRPPVESMFRYLLWPHDPLLLPALGEATSGALERVNSTGQSVVADVKRTLESFRQRYVLTYRPTGVNPSGWHNLDVRVTRPDKVTVRARRGYFGG